MKEGSCWVLLLNLPIFTPVYLDQQAISNKQQKRATASNSNSEQQQAPAHAALPILHSDATPPSKPFFLFPFPFPFQNQRGKKKKKKRDRERMRGKRSYIDYLSVASFELRASSFESLVPEGNLPDKSLDEN